MYQTLSESALLCKRYDKNILHVLWFSVHLQNVNAKFHKVGQRHCSGCSGEAKHVYIYVQQIYSG